jgi:hypothetical protein
MLIVFLFSFDETYLQETPSTWTSISLSSLISFPLSFSLDSTLTISTEYPVSSTALHTFSALITASSNSTLPLACITDISTEVTPGVASKFVVMEDEQEEHVIPSIEMVRILIPVLSCRADVSPSSGDDRAVSETIEHSNPASSIISPILSLSSLLASYRMVPDEERTSISVEKMEG